MLAQIHSPSRMKDEMSASITSASQLADEISQNLVAPLGHYFHTIHNAKMIAIGEHDI